MSCCSSDTILSVWLNSTFVCICKSGVKNDLQNYLLNAEVFLMLSLLMDKTVEIFVKKNQNKSAVYDLHLTSIKFKLHSEPYIFTGWYYNLNTKVTWVIYSIMHHMSSTLSNDTDKL